MSDPFDETQPDSKEWVLEAETEYRFELDPGSSLAIKLARGQAEVFGAELAEGKTYLFGAECKAAVFTWQGCTLEISLPARCQSSRIFLIYPSLHVTGRPSTEYISEETPMAAYANVHIAFEQMRVRALRILHGSPASDDDANANAEPPKVLVLGPENSGKTTVCKILTNYAVRAGQNWSPTLVNVDPSEGGWAVPGAISAATIRSPIATSSPANTLGSAATTAPTALASNALIPLSYWYGHAETKKNPGLLDRLIRNLGENIGERDDNDPEGAESISVSTSGTTNDHGRLGRVSGLIVDTPPSFASSSGSAQDSRHTLIKACVDAFRINVILVVGHEKLTVEMQRLFGSRLTVVKIPKSGGVVELDHSYREHVRNYQLHTYMYGEKVDPPPGITSAMVGGESEVDLILSPSSCIVKFGQLTIYRIGAESLAPSSALPIGAVRTLSEMQPVLVDPASNTSGLLNSVLALLAPFNPDESERYDEEILDLNVVGFLIVTNIDVPHRKMTILAPNQGSLLGKTALIGSLDWQE